MGLCYSSKKIRALAGDKTEWTALEILRRRDIPAKDRLYLALREDFIDAPILHEFGCWCAESVLYLITDPAKKDIAETAISTKRRWVHGKSTGKELDTARYAARATAKDATWVATWTLAQDAAWYASIYAVRSVAPCYDARESARDAQVAQLIKILEEAEKNGTEN
jgi:hypothetical protein